MNEMPKKVLSDLKDAKKTRISGKHKKMFKLTALVILIISLIATTSGCLSVFKRITGVKGKLQPPEIRAVINADGSSQLSITNPNKTGEIYYTLDGAEPLRNSLLYENAFVVEQTTRVNARVIADKELSAVASQQVDIAPAPAQAPAEPAPQPAPPAAMPSIKGLGLAVNSLFDVWASSTLSPINGIYYTAANLVDNNSATAWVEGVSGNGFGQTVTFSYKGPQPAQIQGVEIVNGYAKSNTSFYENGCVTQLDVSINGQFLKSLQLGVTPSPQYLDLNCNLVPGDTIVFEIKGVQEGPSDGEYDTAMSSIDFY